MGFITDPYTIDFDVLEAPHLGTALMNDRPPEPEPTVSVSDGGAFVPAMALVGIVALTRLRTWLGRWRGNQERA